MGSNATPEESKSPTIDRDLLAMFGEGQGVPVSEAADDDQPDENSENPSDNERQE